MQISSKPRLSISFHKFWDGFKPDNSFFVKALSERFDVCVERQGRDVQISSVYGTVPDPINKYRPLRVWYSGENVEPRYAIYDLHFGFHPSCILGKNRWFRFPVWIGYLNWWNEASPYSVHRLFRREEHSLERQHFCNFIYSAPAAIRSEFFLRLNSLRRVESCGSILNNCGWRVEGLSGKLNTLANSTFTISFENQMGSGYVTEKLLHPLFAGSIPIYWGDRLAKEDFNPEAFIYAPDFGDLQTLAEHIVRLSESKDSLAQLFSAPPVLGNAIRYEYTPSFFCDKIYEALEGKLTEQTPFKYKQDNLYKGRPIKIGMRYLRHAARRMISDLFRLIKRKFALDSEEEKGFEM